MHYGIDNQGQSVSVSGMSIFGTLRNPTSLESIDYEIYELSCQNLGIICSEKLRVGDHLELELKDSTLELVVHQIHGLHDDQKDLLRYRLLSMDPKINFEKLFPEGKSRGLNANSRLKIRFARFPSPSNPLVFAKTFGTQISYKLRTLNVSRSGLLLETCPGSDAPFHEGTLLELKIYTSPSQTISCIAKVVRCQTKNGSSSRVYGIALSDMQADQKDLMQQFVEALEYQANKCALDFFQQASA